MVVLVLGLVGPSEVVRTEASVVVETTPRPDGQGVVFRDSASNTGFIEKTPQSDGQGVMFRDSASTGRSGCGVSRQCLLHRRISLARDTASRLREGTGADCRICSAYILSGGLCSVRGRRVVRSCLPRRSTFFRAGGVVIHAHLCTCSHRMVK